VHPASAQKAQAEEAPEAPPEVPARSLLPSSKLRDEPKSWRKPEQRLVPERVEQKQWTSWT